MGAAVAAEGWNVAAIEGLAAAVVMTTELPSLRPFLGRKMMTMEPDL